MKLRIGDLVVYKDTEPPVSKGTGFITALTAGYFSKGSIEILEK